MVLVQHLSKSVEWYTPIEYLDAVREVFGGRIALDPASCAEANERVRADTYYTKEEDGLAQYWFADTLFLNPPYGRTNGKSNQALWSEQLIRWYRMRWVQEAIILVNGAIETHWFQELAQFPMCLVKGRIRFDGPVESKKGPTHGSVFFYLGSNEEKFREVFSRFGTIK